MPRRKLTTETATAHPGRSALRWHLLRHWFWPFVAVVGVAGLLFAGLLVVDSYARARIVEDERYQVAFGDIQCNPPPGMSRAEFLDEVQYYDNLPRSVPARFSLLEANLEAKLGTSFSRHPWVYVTAVELFRPNTVRVRVTYRQPVLAVVVPPPSGSDTQGPKTRALRAIDAGGFILPKKAPIPPGTIVLEHAPQPKSAEGHKWGDQLVEYAAMMLACLDSKEHSPLHEFQLTHMECTSEGLVLWGKGMKVLWGKGDRTEPEQSIKVQRILDTKEQRAILAGWLPVVLEIDVRPIDRAKTRLVMRE
jgi:hypothetical protein